MVNKNANKESEKRKRGKRNKGREMRGNLQ